MLVNVWESEIAFNVNAYKSEYSTFFESGNIDESGKVSSSVNVVRKRHFAGSRILSSTVVYRVPGFCRLR